MIRAWIAGGLATVVAGAIAVDKFDTAKNYVEVKGVVSNIESTCYLKSVDRGVMTKTTTTTDTGPCAEIEELHANHPAYQNMNIDGNIAVEFDYISPADKQQHQGTLNYAYSNADIRKLKYYDSFTLHAHTSDPTKVKR
jgi:hypothetical protein